ncbi:MAG: divergent polysaccharide deacetylase family protein, partial [Desulfobacteraceae bacterium]
MAAKKKAPAKRQRAVKKPRTTKLKKPSVIQELKKILFGLMMLIACILFFAMVADIFLNQLPGKSPEPKPAQVAAAAQETATKKSKTPTYPSQSERNEARETETGIANKQSSGTPKNLSPSKQLKAKPAKTFKFEIFDDANQPVVEGPPDPDPYEPIEPVTPEEKKKPRIAIIIDDIGYDRRLARAFYELDANLTFSILPLAPHGREIADFLHARGAQLMLHLPMEPMEYPEINPGPGAILAKMPPDVLLFNLKRDLNDIPYISGV